MFINLVAVMLLLCKQYWFSSNLLYLSNEVHTIKEKNMKIEKITIDKFEDEDMDGTFKKKKVGLKSS